jgi:hypothetical protein
MIISHKYKFIFIKTYKTAGTSIEIALSKYLGESDVITPISAEDEFLRQDAGASGPQNDVIPRSDYTLRDWARFLFRRKPALFYNHAPATYVRSHVEPEVWNGYYKFCFERNPWDKAVSWYFWRNRREPRPPISEFIQSGGLKSLKSFDLYGSRNQVLVDDVFRYENIADAMHQVTRRLGLPDLPDLPQAKSTQRTDKRSYRDLLTPRDRDIVARTYKREIANLGYEW